MNTLLLVVDMVNGFVKEGAMADPSILACVPTIRELASQANETWLICDAHDEDAIEFESFPVHCLKGTSESQVIDELADLPAIRIEKNSTNAFYVLDQEKLKTYERIVLTGCCTDICVLQLALALKTWANQNDLAIAVEVVEKGVATYDAPGHEAKFWQETALTLLSQAGVKRV